MLGGWKGATRYAAADELLPPDGAWIRTQWEALRRSGEGASATTAPSLLVLDEVQKVEGWSDVVKGLWDEEKVRGSGMRVVLLGSSALGLSRGSGESLAGRFLLHRCLHWSWAEVRAAFGWTLDRWLFFGGYPGAASLAGDEETWKGYIRDALVEPVLARDILALRRVTKPALLRQLFALSCRFPAQVLSYNKMLGRLQDAGNTTTLAEYLRLLESAFLVSGLERFSPGGARSRGSSPKLCVWNGALVSALDLRAFDEARADAVWWGHVVENAVAAHLVQHLQGPGYEVGWWGEGQDEVDLVVRHGARTWAVEVKSGRPRRPRGLAAFLRRVPDAEPVLVGPGGLSLEELFETDPRALFT